MGCNKCYIRFGGRFAEKGDYSGFNIMSWELRSHSKHMQHIKEIKQSKNITQQRAVEKKYGVRYTPLLELVYYDAVRLNVIDPMHNLFLGIAKTMWKVWTNQNIIGHIQASQINMKLQELKTSHGMCPILQGISANWGVWTAYEWKAWTLSCSLYCLKDILTTDQMQCWQKFVKACHLVCKPYLRLSDVHIAQQHLVEFCKQVEVVYGKSVITPNMHFCCHIENMILEYGPVYGIWLFHLNGTMVYNGFHLNQSPQYGISVNAEIFTSKFNEQSHSNHSFIRLPTTF